MKTHDENLLLDAVEVNVQGLYDEVWAKTGLPPETYTEGERQHILSQLLAYKRVLDFIDVLKGNP